MSFPKSFFYSRPHPWHGLSAGDRCPEFVEAYIEITPYDEIKYEVDKQTGYLRIDRPQLTSSLPPTLYGFIPRTYCGDRVTQLAPEALVGDGDPLDICVFTDRPVTRAEILLSAKVIGGFQMIDGDEADDKILAVLENDRVWGKVSDVSDMPTNWLDRLQHYFLTYKSVPGKNPKTHIEMLYGREHALEVIIAARADYDETFNTWISDHHFSMAEVMSIVAAD